MLFDSHCHFDFAEFDQDRDQVWSTAKTYGIQQLLIPTVSPTHWQKATSIAENFTGIYWAAGLHPWWINECLIDSHLHQLNMDLREAIEHPLCVALGETGLDALIDTPLNNQINVLQLHLEIAKQFSKPVIIHSRKTHAELIGLLKKAKLTSAGVIHAFSGSYEQAKAFVDAGFYLGVGGVISYARANKTRDAIKRIPLEYLLLETDAPDMPLEGEQGTQNFPVNLLRVANHLASLKNTSLDTIAGITKRNTELLFGIQDAVR